MELPGFSGGAARACPPFLLVGIALCVCGVVSMFRLSDWRVPWRTFAVGFGGIFGYHFLYFTAFQHAPAVEANLINYLWPLLIVLMSPLFLKDFPLRSQHLVGAGLGLLGAGLIVTGGSLQPDLANLLGYLFAAGAAFAWSCYSLLTKRLPPFPTAAVGGFCFFSGLFSLGVYFLSGGSFDAITALTTQDWVYLVLLGAGPMGLAFFVWDAALKRGGSQGDRFVSISHSDDLNADPGRFRPASVDLGCSGCDGIDCRRRDYRLP